MSEITPLFNHNFSRSESIIKKTEECMNITQSISNNTFFMSILSKIEGYKTSLKEAHWATSGILHIRIDELLSEVGEFQDELAEALMGIEGIMRVGTLKGTSCEVTTALEVIELLKKDLTSIKSTYAHNMEYAGVITSVDGFWLTLNKYTYLLKPLYC